ncbi:MAG: ComEC/Rec2 family competence protein [Puniceicoccales bacterium]|jgi:ComEC/Rec2-related protein|nr:ComEC/Rec2 family competence protein [Puniceicoccales bacterium]
MGIENKKYSFIATPSLHAFAQIVIGILLAKFWNVTLLNVTTLIALCVGVLSHAIGNVTWRKIISAWGCIGAMLLFTLWRMEKPAICSKTQIWKLSYDVEIVKIDRKPSRGKVYGYGTIKKVLGEQYKTLEGHRIYFYLNGYKDYIPSQILRIRSSIRILKPHLSETFFAYLVQKNIFLYAYCGEILKITKDATAIHKFFAHINDYFHRRIGVYIQKHGDHPCDGILYGLLLSEKNELSKKQKDDFHNTGTAHLLAVSGLHIGMIGFALDFLLHCLFLPKNWRRLPILGIIFFYVGAIGFPPSAVRAWLMISCHWMGNLFCRNARGTTSLLNAAIFSLIGDPMLLFDIGFQLSYGVVAMLLLLANPMRDSMLWGLKSLGFRKVLRRKNRKTKKAYMLRKGVALLAVSMAATLASTPLTFEYFNQFSLTGILLNPIVIQIALPSVVSGFLFLLIGSLSIEGWPSSALFLSARSCVAWINGILSWAETYVPWHIEFLTKPKGLGLLCFVMGLIFALWLYMLHQRVHQCKAL